jgi:F-type H+-transporting ATPase subunit epsilon
MATFHFELTSPERLVFSGEVEHVVVPGSEGEFGVLAEHAPLIAMLRPGILTILGPSERRFVVRGGFVEEVDRDVLAGQIKDMEEDAADAPEGHLRDRAMQRLDQLKAVQAALGH